MKSFFTVWNKKTLEYVAPAVISEKGEIFMEDDGHFYLANDQDDLEIHLFNGIKLPVVIIRPIVDIQEQIEKIEDSFGVKIGEKNE